MNNNYRFNENIISNTPEFDLLENTDKNLGWFVNMNEIYKQAISKKQIPKEFLVKT